MPTLYIANKNYSSWSLRPWVLLHELGIPFDEQLVPCHVGKFGGFSPSGKVPCLVDGAVTVWDSLAITEYLAEAHPGVWPADRVARAFARCVAPHLRYARPSVSRSSRTATTYWLAFLRYCARLAAGMSRSSR